MYLNRDEQRYASVVHAALSSGGTRANWPSELPKERPIDARGRPLIQGSPRGLGTPGGNNLNQISPTAST